MSTKNYQRWEDADKLMRLVDRILEKNPSAIAIDIESGYVGADRSGISLLPFHPDWRLVSFQFTVSKDYALYIPIGHDAGGNMDTLGAARALWKICSSGKCIAQNFSFELQGLSRFFREVLWDDPELGEAVRESEGYFPIKSDTMIEAYMMAEFQTIGLKDLTHRVLQQEQAEITTLFPELAAKKKTRFLRFNTLDSFDQAVIDYACDDVTTCIQLHERHYPQVENMLMFKTEIALTPVLCKMEKEGMLLDWAEYQRQESQVAKLRELMNEDLQQSFSERLGENIVVNLASPPQVGVLLYDKLKYPVKEHTETGARGTGEGALRTIAKKDPDVAGILTWREVSALLTRYLTKYLKEFRYAEDGRAHPNHNQAGAATGRLSVSGVSYQQWPKPYHFELKSGTTYDLNYRDFLIAPEGYRIIGYDFSQVELRILAGMANEQALLKAFYDDVDIHRATASAMMKIPLDEVTKKQRSQGKALADDELVLTPSGWSRIGEMQVGEEVILPSGGTALVGGVYPQGVRQLYRVSFDDGTSVEADGEHRWMVYHSDNPDERIMTTNELIESGTHHGKDSKRPTTKWRIRNVETLQMEETDLPIHPYIMGALLGDGSLSAPAVSLANHLEDREIADRVAALLPEDVQLEMKPGKSTSWVFTSKVPGAYRNRIDRDLKELGLRGSKSEFGGRWGVKSHEKRVPLEYLFSSPEQRLEVLRGLADTDGHADAHGWCDFVSISEGLVEDVEFLVRSLGGRANRQSARRGSYSYLGEARMGAMAYRTRFTLPRGMNPFFLSRKAQHFEDKQKPKRSLDKKIVSIEPTRESHATCILVDHDEHQFITTGMTRTMNTLNFAVVYGSGAANIGEMLGIPTDEAQGLLNTYFDTFSGLKAWMASKVVEGRQQKYVETIFGRKYRLWEYSKPEAWQQAAGDRLCVNAPVQGGAADYMKLGMVRVDAAIRKAESDGRIPKGSIRLIMTVHDALEFYVSNEVSTQQVIDLINPAVSFRIPKHDNFPEIRADWHEGYRWGSVVEIKTDKKKQITGYALEDVDIHFDTIEAAYSYQDEHKKANGLKEVEAGDAPEPPMALEPEVPDEEPDLVAAVLDAEPEWLHSKEEFDAPQNAVVALMDMPEESEWDAFTSYLKEHSGSGSVVVRVPEGELALDGYQLGTEDFPEIEKILPGSVVSLQKIGV